MSYKTYYSDSGSFLCDQNGLLVDFSPAGENKPPYLNLTVLRHLHVPKGVRRIGYDQPEPGKSQRCAFNDTIIMGDVMFPHTLRGLGYNAFSRSVILHLTIPSSVNRISHGAFMSCYIHTLEVYPAPIQVDYGGESPIPPGMLSIGERDFKQTTIEELIIHPGKIPDGWLQRLMPEANVIKKTILT